MSIADDLARIAQAKRGRDVRKSIHDAIKSINDVTQEAMDTAFVYIDIDPTDVDSTVAKIVAPGSYRLDSSASWTDVPDSTKSYDLLVFQCDTDFVIQIIVEAQYATAINTSNIYWRQVKISTTTPYPTGETWKEINGGFAYKGTSEMRTYEYVHDTYDNKTCNIKQEGSFYLKATDDNTEQELWTDTPLTSKTWGLLVFRLNTRYYLQICYDPFASADLYIRTTAGNGYTYPSDGGWTNIGASSFFHFNLLTPTYTNIHTLYDNKVSNIRQQGSFFLRKQDQTTGQNLWTDTPDTSRSWGLTEFQMNTQYYIQIVYDALGESNVWWRIVGPNLYPSSGWNSLSAGGGGGGDVTNRYVGKKFSVLGDSISSYDGTAGCTNAMYPGDADKQALTGITSVDQMWWKIVGDTLGMTYIRNNSIGGRCVTEARHPSDSTTLHRYSPAYKQAQIDALKDGSTIPDVIFVKVGVNDFNHGATLGDLNPTKQMSDVIDDFEDGVDPLADTAPDNSKIYTDGLRIVLHRIMTTYPNAEVWVSTIQHMRPGSHGGGENYPEVNRGNEPLSAYNDAIVEVCNQMGAHVLRHDMCGITAYNDTTTLFDTLHPSAGGMTMIAVETIRAMS